MGNNSDYIKDIEKYFLSLAGEGIMLSSMDYTLIQGWKNKGIPKEVVFKGINRAFEISRAKDGPDSNSLRNLKQCVQYIESSIEEYKPILGSQDSEAESFDNEQGSILEKLNKYIADEKPGIVQNYYLNMKQKLVSSTNNSDDLTLGVKIEEECLQEFFTNLSDTEKEDITLEASNRLGSRARHMTETAVEESLVSFRNEILIERSGLKSLI